MTNWTVDKAHSRVAFTARHMMITKVRGEFTDFDVDFAFNADAPAKSVITATIAADSITTNDEKRDAHLRSADFLHADTYPTLTFTSTRIEQTDAHHGKLIGDLTIGGVTKEVALDVTYSGLQKSPWGQPTAAFTATTNINRKDWGLEWNMALETGGFLVGDIINIEIDIELVPVAQPEAAAAA